MPRVLGPDLASGLEFKTLTAWPLEGEMSVAASFRVIDTGVREGRANIAFDAALVELHGEGRIPDTLRFLRFRPTALVGRHQSLRRELRLDYCKANGIGLARRITGGGAIYFDEGQLGWELVFSRQRLGSAGLAATTQRICSGAARGLSEVFGIDARFRPRNDIEVGGRKLSGTGGFFDGDTLFFQGTVLIDVAPERVMACLNVPRAKLEKRALDKAEHRIVTLAELLGQAPAVRDVEMAIARGLGDELGLNFMSAAPSEAEEKRARELYDQELGTDAFVLGYAEPQGSGVHHAARTGPGGTVVAHVRLEGRSGAERIGDVLITGDFLLTPPRLVMDLEAALRGVAVCDAGAVVTGFFRASPHDLLSIQPEDFQLVVEDAIGVAQRGQHA